MTGWTNLDVVRVFVIVGGVEDDLRAWLGGDVSWGNGLSHVDGYGGEGWWGYI